MIGVKATVLPWMRIFIARFLCNCLYGKGDRICVANSRCLEVVQVSASHKVLRNGHIPKTIHTAWTTESKLSPTSDSSS